MHILKQKRFWVTSSILIMAVGLALASPLIMGWAIIMPKRSQFLFVVFMLILAVIFLISIGVAVIYLQGLVLIFSKTAPDVQKVISLSKQLIDKHAAHTTLDLAEGMKWVIVASHDEITGPVYSIVMEEREFYWHEDGDREMRFVTRFIAGQGMSKLPRNVGVTNIPDPNANEHSDPERRPKTFPTDELYKFYMFWAWHKRLFNRRWLENEFRHADELQTKQLVESLRLAAAWQGIALDG